ncbi:fructose-1,6-bisphosphatase [Anaeromicropila herbilytica]|uniref:Fructose-1,6-bisphosphatase class 3 n=1 Tax=Anaeromicropila herbilytica TaxID=2785025 RepID=A0A7R7EQD8_9FIRM|nr:fructose-1,6-bisphosphatase [Anaeromicropila herbilytica]BCN32840.1 fructose-1,6-bisphosphatase class 3 [Anaeromicropila herbilytica]
MQKKYLRILANQYPTIRDAATEIINLQAILSLPKGTEHFLTDLHGEYEQFHHVLKNGSGTVRRKIDEIFGNTLMDSAKRSLATLIYYPKEKLEMVRGEEQNIDDWYRITLHRLVRVLKNVSSKYTRSKVRKAIPKDFVYVVEELITEKEEVLNKEAYYNEIIHTIVRIGDAEPFIQTLCDLIQRLVIDHLHILGDIYDRGPGPHIIIDTLMNYHTVDIQWGNHDIVWMGAASGQYACIANVIRMALKYENTDVLEEGYGINLMSLAAFALKEYQDVNCDAFQINSKDSYGVEGIESKMYKAISIIQFKLEGQLIIKYPEFEMDHQLLLDKINYEKKTIVIEGKEYALLDIDFPTVSKEHPYQLTKEEELLMKRLKQAFLHSDKLQMHMSFLYSRGALYNIYNSNLLYHGCIPLDRDGEFTKLKILETEYSGKNLYDVLDYYARKGYFATLDSKEKEMGEDLLWYIWTGPKSPVFGRSKMATFERLLIADKEAYHEVKNPYYEMIDNENLMDNILKEFGLESRNSHIINGHVPVEVKNGQNPVKCGGKLLMIDGGFSKSYHDRTGIAGYTLVLNSTGIRLVAHETFESARRAIQEETDIVSDSYLVERFPARRNVGDTDIGYQLKENIADLEELLTAYRNNEIMQVSKSKY